MNVIFNGELIEFPDSMDEAEIARILAAEAEKLEAAKREALAQAIREALDLDAYADRAGVEAESLSTLVSSLGDKADEIKAILERPIEFPEFPDQLTVDMPDRWDEVLSAINAIEYPAPVVEFPDFPALDTQPIVEAIQQIKVDAVDLSPLAEIMRSIKMGIDSLVAKETQEKREPKGFRINPSRPDGARIVDLIY